MLTPVKFTPLKFSRSNSARVTTSKTSTLVPNFIAISLRRAYPQICEILRFCDFFIVRSCPVLVILFFSQLRPGRTPGRILTIYGLNDASSPTPRMCLLGVWMTTHNIKGFKTPHKTPKNGAWLGIFQPKWQNYKIVISPAGIIESTPNFDRAVKPHI